MTDKEKQIDSLANALYNKQDEFDMSNPFEVAEMLYNAGYRKIPDGSVVLSKEEYNEIKQHQCYILEMEKAFDKVHNNAVKETAKKIFVVLINALLTRKERAKKFYSIKESAGVDMAIDTTKKIAKQFGVEV